MTASCTVILNAMSHKPRVPTIALWSHSHNGDLIGKTRERLRSLHFRRDRDWLRS